MFAEIRAFLVERRAFLVASMSSLALRVAGLLSGFALGVVLARSLGPTAFGIYGLVTTAAGLMMMVALLGTPQLAVRELSVRSARGDWTGVKAVLTQFGAATTAASIVLGAIAAAVATFAIPPGSPMRLYVLQGALLTLLMAWTGLMASELRGLGALFKGQVLDVFVRPALGFAGVLALILMSFRVTAADALWVQIGVTLLTALLSFAWIRRALPAEARSVPRAAKVPWLAAALPLGAVDMLRQLDGAYGVILMGWLASGAELGVFRVAIACGVLAIMPVTLLHVILAPTVSRLHDFD
jgi:O-antigen/teichoic acid export membrane protein